MNEWVNEEGGGTYLNLATTTNPTGGPSAWTGRQGPGDYLTSLSCGPGGICAGGDEFGTVVATPNAGGREAWKPVGNLPATLDWQTCASAKLCIGVEDSGRPVASTRPAVAKSWVTEKLPRGQYMRIVSCAGAGFCVAAGGNKQRAGDADVDHADERLELDADAAAYRSDGVDRPAVPFELVLRRGRPGRAGDGRPAVALAAAPERAALSFAPDDDGARDRAPRAVPLFR